MTSAWAWLISILAAISTLLSIANTIWSWKSQGGARLAAKLGVIEGCLDDHGDRLISIEGELRHIPSKEDVTGLRLELAVANGKLNTAEAELNSVARTVRRIEDHLLGVKA